MPCLLAEYKIKMIDMVKKYGEYIKESVDLDQQLLDASRTGDIDQVKELLDGGIDIDTKDKHGYTSLAYACCNDQTGIVYLLLNRGAKTDTKNKYGDTPLLSAIWYGFVEIVKHLLEYGADINV